MLDFRLMTRWVKILALSFTSQALLVFSALAQDVFLTGGKLVDPLTRTVREANLLISGGKIAGSPVQTPKDFQGETLDVQGHWIIPGLHDLHTHSVLNAAPGGTREMLGTEIAARRMLYAGVTGFLDLFNQEQYIFGLRDRQRQSTQPTAMADVFAAGACLTASGGHGTEYPIPARIVDTPEDAKREVADLAKLRPDVVKIIYDHMSEESKKLPWRTHMPSLDKATLRAAISEAKAHDIRTVIHIHSWQDVRDSVDTGADAVTHLPPGGTVPKDLLKKMADAGTTVIPTLTVGDTAFIEPLDVLEAPLLRSVTNTAMIDAYRQFSGTEGGQNTLRALRPVLDERFQMLRQLAKAGVPIATGTDAGNPFTLQGYSLHRELAMMVDAGLDPWDALASATTTAGAFLRRPIGLAAGDLGSVVVLEASPIEDIRNTEQISQIIHHGVVLDRETLKAQPTDFWRPPMPPQTAP